MLLLIFTAFILFYYWYICLCHRVVVTKQFPHFAGMTHKRLPSFGDEILTLLFNSALDLLRVCLDYVYATFLYLFLWFLIL